MEHIHAARKLDLIVSNIFLIFVYDLVLLVFNVTNSRVFLTSPIFIFCAVITDQMF